MNKILVTGYNSFIAKNFIKKIKNTNLVFHYKGDINNINNLKKIFRKKKITHFVHFAGLSREKCSVNKSECIKTNFLSIKLILNYLNTLKSKPTFIFISSSHVYKNNMKKLTEQSQTNPKTLYAKLKIKSENYIKKYYKDYSIIRLFNVYGKNQPNGYFISDMKLKIKNNEKISIDKSIRDFIHVSEVSKIINFIIKKNILDTINVGSGKGRNLKTIINLIGKKLDKKPLIELSKNHSKIVADISLLKSYGYKFSKNEKNFNI